MVKMLSVFLLISISNIPSINAERLNYFDCTNNSLKPLVLLRGLHAGGSSGVVMKGWESNRRTFRNRIPPLHKPEILCQRIAQLTR